MRAGLKQGMLAIATTIALGAWAIGEAGAVTRYWVLQGVVFSDGATATGSFGFDDVANEVTGWNVRVQGGAGFLPFTYLPGNSIAFNNGGSGYYTANLAAPTIQFRSEAGGNGFQERLLQMTPVAALDGAAATVAIDLATLHGRAGAVECFNCGGARTIEAGSLVLALFPLPLSPDEVVEFHHAAFNHYFMSADPVEIYALDTGYFTGWTRTGYSFMALATGSRAGPTMNPVCRYYGLPAAGLDSHFYSADAAECFRVNRDYGNEWQIESDNVFQIDLPDVATGACPGGAIPVYRIFNGRKDANHRYTTSTVVRAQMEEAGWIREGYGPNATIMCAVGVL